MNICMMTNTYLPHVGGVARSVHTFAEEFRRRGHTVLVVAPSYPEPAEPEVERHVVRLPALQQFNGSDFSVSLPFTAHFSFRVAEFDADIIHSHHPFLVGDSALRIAADKRVPIVFTHHTLYEEYTHYVPFDSPTFRKFAVELSTQYANLCDAVIAPSRSIADLIRQRGVRTRIQVIPTGIDVGAFAGGDGSAFRERLGIGPESFVVGHVGRLATEKNLPWLARAVRQFVARRSDAVFLVVGTGPSEDELRRIFAEVGAADRLFLAGKRTGRDLCDAYAAMNAFAFSSFSETQGVVLAEAMAAGLPVVALDASGVREIVRDGRNGFLLGAASSEVEFAGRLEELCSTPDLCRRLSGNARRTAKRYSREASAEKALALYERVRGRTRREFEKEEAHVWAALKDRMEVEWGLLAEKAESAIYALFADEETRRDRPN